MPATKWKLATGKTWRSKLEQDHPNHGKQVAIPQRWQAKFGKGTMVIPKPRDVDALIRTVRKGKVITSSKLRERLAEMYGADAACPLTTGMFVVIAAQAAEEDRRAGKRRITPYWRVIKDDGKLNPKFPGGASAQARQLRDEGLTITRGKGKQPPRVADYDQHLARI